MNRSILCLILLLAVTSCNKKDKEEETKSDTWKETTKVSSPYLQRITLSTPGDTVVLFEFVVDVNKDFTALHIGNTSTIYDMIIENFKKDKNGRVTMATQRLALATEGLWMRFNYGQQDRIASIDHSSTPTVNYTYDAQGRVTKAIEEKRTMTYHYNGTNHEPDSSVLTSTLDPTVYTEVYTYGSATAPINTLPLLVRFLHYNQFGFNHMWHDVTSVVSKENGVVRSTYNYSSTYDAAGKLITRKDVGSGMVYTYHYAQ